MGNKICPIVGSNHVNCENCAWYLQFAEDCSIPTIAGILADSFINRTNFHAALKIPDVPTWRNNDGYGF